MSSDMDTARRTFQAVLSKSEALLARMGISYEEAYRMCCHALIQSQIRSRGGSSAHLGECTPDSIKLALIKCLNAGLAPDGEEVALVPLRRGQAVECEAWIGIVGKLKLARMATPGLAIEARTVYRDDEFEVEFGLNPKLAHRPDSAQKRDEAHIVAVYAIARMPGNAHAEVEVWYRPDIDRYRAMSKAKRGPWSSGHYGEMAERGPLGALLKRLPKRAVHLSDPDDVPFAEEVADASPQAPASRRAPRAAVEHLPKPTVEPPAPAQAAADAEPAQAAADAEPAQPPISAYEEDPFG